MLSALTALIDAGARPSVGEIAASLDRERSQVSRTLTALAEAGLVERRADRSFTLSWGWYARAQELTAQRMRSQGIAVLQELSAQIGEASFLGVLQGNATLTVLECIPAHSRMIGSWIGRAYPAYCSDAGRSTLWDASDDEVRAVFANTEFTPQGPNTPASVADLLSRLDADRARGYSIVDQEAEPGLYSVAAPVRDFRDEVIAAVQVVGTVDSAAGNSPRWGAACADAAARLSRALGAPSPTR